MKNTLTRVKRFIKKHRMLGGIIHRMQDGFFRTATVISPALNTRLWYLKVFHKWPDLKNPATFNEKLLCLKLRHMKDPLVIQCADKYRVRDYVRGCGCGQYLNELYGAYDRADEIPWDDLPERFVVKWNFGAGMNLVCPDRKGFDCVDAVRTLNKWEREKVWLSHAEMQYKYAPRKLICEKYLEEGDGSESLTDYKVYCFHGKPEAILVMHDRSTTVRTEFFDPSWRKLENTSKYPEPEVPTPKPACLEELLEAARRLSKPFDFVRCDFYIVDGRPVFGELTFTPAGGLYIAQTKIDGREMTEFLHIS